MKYVTIFISIIAVLLSALALRSSIHSSERARGCEFLYRTYDRLNELYRYTNREKARQMQCEPIVERLNTSDGGGVSEEEKKVCGDFTIGTVATIIRSKKELELHRVSFESTDLSPVMDSADNAIEKFEKWTNDPEAGLWNNLSQLLSAYSSVAEFRVRMIGLIESDMKTTAESIRDRCR